MAHSRAIRLAPNEGVDGALDENEVRGAAVRQRPLLTNQVPTSRPRSSARMDSLTAGTTDSAKSSQPCSIPESGSFSSSNTTVCRRNTWSWTTPKDDYSAQSSNGWPQGTRCRPQGVATDLRLLLQTYVRSCRCPCAGAAARRAVVAERICLMRRSAGAAGVTSCVTRTCVHRSRWGDQKDHCRQ